QRRRAQRRTRAAVLRAGASRVGSRVGDRAYAWLQRRTTAHRSHVQPRIRSDDLLRLHVLSVAGAPEISAAVARGSRESGRLRKRRLPQRARAAVSASPVWPGARRARRLPRLVLIALAVAAPPHSC